MHTTERFLRTLTEERWGLREEPTEGVSVMAEEEAAGVESDPGSDSVLLDVGDHPALSVGERVPVIVQQMRDLEEILRESARNCSALSELELFYAAEKALFRCTDIVKRFNDDVREQHPDW